MKKYFIRIGFLAAIVFSMAISSSAQVYVKVRPVVPVIVRPVPPGAAHVWVEEEWVARDGRYVFMGGHWAAPPHPGWLWVPGHWKRHQEYGEYWVPGHWKKA